MIESTRLHRMARISALGLGMTLAACAPKIYVIDRQTVLEQEAAGEWPEFEKELTEKSVVSGPVPFSKTPASAERRRLYNVLNGELAGENGAGTEVPQNGPKK